MGPYDIPTDGGSNLPPPHQFVCLRDIEVFNTTLLYGNGHLFEQAVSTVISSNLNRRLTRYIRRAT